MRIVQIGRFYVKLHAFGNREKCPKMIKILIMAWIREKSLIFGLIKPSDKTILDCCKFFSSIVIT